MINYRELKIYISLRSFYVEYVILWVSFWKWD